MNGEKGKEIEDGYVRKESFLRMWATVSGDFGVKKREGVKKPPETVHIPF